MTRQALLGSLVSALVALPPLAAGELSLLEAMATARVQAQEVLAAQARAAAESSRLAQAQSSRLPLISLQEMWISTDNPAEVFALQLNQERFAFEQFVMADPNEPERLDNATTRILLTLPVYTGGELSGRIGQARAAAEAAAIRAAWVETGAALAAAEAYVRLAQARENVTLLEQVVETLEAHVALARAYVGQGMAVRSELLQAEVEWSRVADLLAEARGRARVAESNLSFRLAADPATEWRLEPLRPPSAIAGSLADWLGSTTLRADLQAARRLLDAAELEIRVRRAARLPKLGLAARYELYDDVLFGANGRSGAVMAMASVDLFSGGRHRSAQAAAESELEAGRQQIAQLEAAVRLEVRDAYERAVSARERHRTALSAQQAATEAERIIGERFRQGVEKMTDLLDATTARREAQTRELVARADAHLAGLALAVSSGRRPESLLAVPAATEKRSES